MSPPTNTASRYTHRFCTVIQLSIMSEELDSFWTHNAMSFLKGALYLNREGAQGEKVQWYTYGKVFVSHI